VAFSKEVSQWFQFGLKFLESDRIIAKIDSTVKPSDPVFWSSEVEKKMLNSY
jgi:hypothetical protein